MADPLPIATVLICTHNRAPLLDEALVSLAATRSSFAWDLLVVDNCSTDDTRSVIGARAASFPVPLHYLFEPRLGKSYALNTGIAAAAGGIIVFGDDDQRFAPDWVGRSCAPLLADATIDYTGGPVLPLFEAPPPRWLDLARAEYRAPLGLFDYGLQPFIFEERSRVAGGGNMAVRQALLAKIGGFREDLGRRGRSLLGQEQAEFFSRTRAAGVRGLFVPDMLVWHHVPIERLHRRYFLRWWFWKGIAHARWHAVAGRTEDGLDLVRAPRLRRVPRFLYGEGLRAILRSVKAIATCDGAAAVFLPVLRLAYLAGYASELRRARWSTPSPSAFAEVKGET